MKPEKSDLQDSFNLASKAVSDAVEYDNKHNYKEAHALYLKAVGLFEDSVEAECNETKLNVLRNRIAAYKKRAAELDSFLKSNPTSSHTVRMNDIELEMGVTKKVSDAGQSKTKANEDRLERMVYGLGVLVGVLLVSVIGMFAMLQVHIANTSDYATNNELEVTQEHLNTVANAVLRMSTASEVQSGEAVFNNIEDINTGEVKDFTAEIEGLKVELSSVKAVLDAKADSTSVYNIESIDSFISSMMTKAEAAELTTVLQTKADAVNVNEGLEGVETLLNQVDLRLSSELSGISGIVNDLSDAVGALNGEIEIVGTTSTTAIHDLEASFSGVVLELHNGFKALEDTLELKVNSNDVYTKRQNLLSVINTVGILSGTTIDDTVARTFFTEEADLEIDLSISAVDFAHFEEQVIEDLAEVRSEVEGLEENLELKADANAVASNTANMREFSGILEGKVDAAVVDDLSERLGHVREEIEDAVATSIDQEEVAEMISKAVEALDISSILASIEAVVANLEEEEVTRMEEMSSKVDEDAYNLKIEDLENKMAELSDSITDPVACSWSGTREVFADNRGCKDDLLLTCENGVVTTLRMRCGN
jgi:hypothetical protein